MKESLYDKFKRLFKDLEEKTDIKLSKPKKFKLAVDFIFEKVFYKIELVDYIQYQFYYKNRAGRDQYVTHPKLLRIIRACNDPNLRDRFDNKVSFNSDFSQYLGREYLDASSSSLEEIKAFINKHGQVFLKVKDGMFGIGIDSIDRQKIKDDENLLNDIKKKGLLLEEKLEQYEEFAEFNRSSVNSMRLVTLNTLNDGVKVMVAVLRLGRQGKIADNFHHNGIATLIDIKSGLVYTRGIDSNYDRYIYHPDSNKKIVGFEIPFWDEIVETVKKAALVHPQVRYVGWDVAVKKDGSIVLIEGNPGADFDITQIPDQIGVWEDFRPYIEELEN